jgi:ankyrin repeat protein
MIWYLTSSRRGHTISTLETVPVIQLHIMRKLYKILKRLRVLLVVFNICNFDLHRAKHGSLDCLELLVGHDGIDLDAKNTLEGDTPLHKAVEFTDDPDVAIAMVEILLEAEADPRYDRFV